MHRRLTVKLQISERFCVVYMMSWGKTWRGSSLSKIGAWLRSVARQWLCSVLITCPTSPEPKDPNVCPTHRSLPFFPAPFSTHHPHAWRDTKHTLHRFTFAVTAVLYRTVSQCRAARTNQNYIHRIGRTARGNASGDAYTFFTSADAKFANKLVGVLRGANQDVPAELQRMDRGGGGRGGGRGGWRGGRGGRGGGRGRGGGGRGRKW